MAAAKKPAARKPRAPAAPPTVAAAVERDLKEIAKRDKDLAASALAASARVLAAELDADNSATSKSMCARALRETMDRLRELLPPAEEEDKLDDLARRRRARLAAS